MDKAEAIKALETIYAEVDGKTEVKDGNQTIYQPVRNRGVAILFALGFERPRGINYGPAERKKTEKLYFAAERANDAQGKTALKLAKMGWRITHVVPISDAKLQLIGGNAPDAVEFEVSANGSKGTIKRDGTFIRR